jgi:hypothetical protein
VTIFNKRNAAVGYLTLKALDRRHRRRSGLRLGLYVALGLVSFGILAAAGADTVVLTCAVGGLLNDDRPGDFSIVTDHINLTGTTPVHGGAKSIQNVLGGQLQIPAVGRVHASSLCSDDDALALEEPRGVELLQLLLRVDYEIGGHGLACKIR